MLHERRRSTRRQQLRLSPANGAERGFLRQLRFTPRLELLEDRTLLTDGVLDQTFGVRGLVNTGLSYLNSYAGYPLNPPSAVYASAPTHQNSLAVQTIAQVSKYIVAGVSQGPTTKFSVGRFKSDGTLDTTFGSNGLAVAGFPGSASDQANAVAVQSDGSIVVAGSTTVGALKQFGAV